MAYTRAPGSGPGGLGGGGWETIGGQEWSAGSAAAPGSWTTQQEWENRPAPNLDRRLTSAWEGFRPQFNQIQQQMYGQDHNRWLETSNQVQQQNPAYWEMMYKPLYDQWYKPTQAQPDMASMLSNMYGS